MIFSSVILAFLVTLTSGSGPLGKKFDHYPELEPLLDRVQLSRIDPVDRLSSVVLRKEGWVTSARAVLLETGPAGPLRPEALARDTYSSGSKHVGSILHDFLTARGEDFFDTKRVGMTFEEESTLLRVMVRLGQERRWTTPRASDLVVLKRLTAASSNLTLEGRRVEKALAAVRARGLGGVGRIVVLTAVAFPGGEKPAPKNPRDFRDPARSRVRESLSGLLDALHGTYGAMDLSVRSSASADEDLFFAVHAAPGNLILDRGNFGHLAGALAAARWGGASGKRAPPKNATAAKGAPREGPKLQRGGGGAGEATAAEERKRRCRWENWPNEHVCGSPRPSIKNGPPLSQAAAKRGAGTGNPKPKKDSSGAMTRPKGG